MVTSSVPCREKEEEDTGRHSYINLARRRLHHLFVCAPVSRIKQKLLDTTDERFPVQMQELEP